MIKFTLFQLFSFVIITAILFAGCNIAAETFKPGASTDKNGLITENVNLYLSENFSGWEIAQKTDYINSWWSFYDRDNVPYVVKTDINDDAVPDYGIIIKKADSIKLVLLTGKQTSFNHWEADNFAKLFNSTLKNLHLGLSIEPPGRIDIAYPQIRSLVLKSNAINLMDHENRVSAYYWENDTIKVFQTN